MASQAPGVEMGQCLAEGGRLGGMTRGPGFLVLIVALGGAADGHATPPQDLERARFSGEIAGRQAFRRALSPGWNFVLAPVDHGWKVFVEDPEGRDLSSGTPPRHGPNPREILGWHFRNAANTGTNTGDINAPQHLREFIFDIEPGREAHGAGWLRIEDFGLADLEPGQRARMVYLKFTVELTWPAGASVRPEPSAELLEQFGACGLAAPYRVANYLHPHTFEGDLDGDGSWDQVALVERADGKRGLAICRAGTWLHVLGFEGRMGHLVPEYFDRMDTWALQPKGPVHQGVGEGAPPVLHGDAILLGKKGASSVLVYWDGEQFAAYWQGD